MKKCNYLEAKLLAMLLGHCGRLQNHCYQVARVFLNGCLLAQVNMTLVSILARVHSSIFLCYYI